MQEMIARRDLGHDAPKFFMLRDLRSNFTGQKLAIPQDRDRRLIA